MTGPGNPNHDPKTGEFTSGSGSGSASGHNAGGGNRKIADHVKLQHRVSDDDFLRELAKKHDPKGYAQMMGVKSLREAIIKHQNGPNRNKTVLPSGGLDKNGLWVTEGTENDSRLKKIQNLIDRPGTAGEKKAARSALKRLKGK